MPQPFLSMNGIDLRPLRPEDLEGGYKDWFNDESVCEFNSHHRFPKVKDNLSDYYNSLTGNTSILVLAIVDQKTGRHVGNVSLQSIDYIDRSAELAIIIGEKDFWGKGIGEVVCRLMVKHGFEELNLNRIYLGTAENNVSMRRVAEKLGFKEEGTARQAIFKSGVYHNVVNYGLLRTEYEE